MQSTRNLKKKSSVAGTLGSQEDIATYELANFFKLF